MNADIKRTFMTGTLIACAGAAAISYFVVQPKVTTATEVRSELAREQEFIEKGEQEIASSSDRVDAMVAAMRDARDAMLGDLSNTDPTQSQQQLQRLANDRGLTVTRIEPVRSSFDEVKTGSPEQDARIEIKEYRVECRGAFNAVVAFIDDLQRGSGQPRVSSFRMVPADAERVRAVVSVEMLEMVDYPDSFKNAFKPAQDGAGSDEPSDGEESE